MNHIWTESLRNLLRVPCRRFGDIKVTDFCEQGKTCGRTINIQQDGQQHGEKVKHGGHTEANKDARLAFSNHMVMWKSPNKYDVLYRIQFVLTFWLFVIVVGFSGILLLSKRIE